MNRMEQLPEQLIDWLGKREFDSLDIPEQKLVLEFMKREEYETMHHAAVAGRQYFAADTDLKAPAAIRHKLQTVLQQKKIRPVLLQPVAVWKVAAVLLLMLSGFSFYIRTYSPGPQTPLLVHDTVWMEKKVPEIIRITDTVIAWHKPGKGKKQSLRTARLIASAEPANDTNHRRIQEDAQIGIRTFQMEDLSKESLQNGSKSLHEDELSRQFGQFSFART